MQAPGGANDVPLLPLPQGHALIASERRRGPRTASRFEYDKLAVLTHSFEWIKGYAQFFGNNLYVDPFFLCREAWRRFAEGGYGVALRFMERAVACSPVLEQEGFLRAQAQGIRIGLQRFAEAAAEPDPSPALAPAVRGFLLQNKGWGLVMGNEPARAEPYFREARALLAPLYQQKREYLYLLNISALSCLERGDLDGALAIEREIAAQTALQTERDWRLEYVNAINLARLYRRREEYDAAEACYRRAFETTLGARSESDALYTNVCLARVAALQGRPTEAFWGWLRAALHWVASSTPEAIAPRVAKAIVGRILPPGGDLPEAISSALFTALLSSTKTSALTPLMALTIRDSVLEKSPIPVFLRADSVREEQASVASVVGARGWGVLTTSMQAPLQFTGMQHRRLRALVAEICTRLCPSAGWQNTPTLIVDDQFGREVPENAPEMILTGLRWNAPNIIYEDNVIVLDQKVRSRFDQALRVRLGDAVAKIERHDSQDCIVFKRYLSPRAVSGKERQLLSLLDDHPSIGELWRRTGQQGAFEDFIATVRALERSRVVVLSLANEIGIGTSAELRVEESHAR
jgi:tetratricopeptide (TPR) repeat protein